MTRATIARGAIATALVLLAAAAGYRALVRDVEPAEPAAETSPAISPSTAPAAAAALTYQGFLYGRITALDGTIYEGRLRWGSGEEAFWGDSFNGFKEQNPWAAYVPPDRLKARVPIEIFGFEVAHREHEIALGRPFMARFGDIARIEASRRDVQVTLKSGTLLHLDRLEAGDFDDGVRVWDERHGVVNLDSLQIATIELLSTAPIAAAPGRLHGTVRTGQGEFRGFVQWNRLEGVASDALDGETAEGEPLALPFDSIRAIARRSSVSSSVTLLDGREVLLSGNREVGRNHLGIYVDDRRYGRVLVPWDAFERLDFSDLGAVGTGPAYDDFPPGRPLTGSVTTRDGRTLAGRLVYDLDESETTETLDAGAHGVNYTIPFGLIATIALGDRDDPDDRDAQGAARAKVTLQSGEELQLEHIGDLGAGHGGLLIFVDDAGRPEHVRWAEVQRIDLDRPPAMVPPLP